MRNQGGAMVLHHPLMLEPKYSFSSCSHSNSHWAKKAHNEKKLRTNSGAGSEEVSLFHDPQELLFVDFTIAIAVCFINHLLQFFIGHSLTKLFGNTLEVLERDLSRLIIIEEPEGLQDLILGVAIQDFVSHHLQELFVLNGATAIIINIRNHFLDLLLLWLEAEGTHGNLQLLGVNGSRTICIKEIECLFDFLLLLLCELLLLLATSVET